MAIVIREGNARLGAVGSTDSQRDAARIDHRGFTPPIISARDEAQREPRARPSAWTGLETDPFALTEFGVEHRS
ncbi:MAG TPA: hypothetical protein VGA37_09115 [Gemmatimonadales bacterium]